MNPENQAKLLKTFPNGKRAHLVYFRDTFPQFYTPEELQTLYQMDTIADLSDGTIYHIARR
jgi:hypothetical protein